MSKGDFSTIPACQWSTRSITSRYLPDGHHEHPDCVRMAGAWLQAQHQIKGCTKSQLALKHIIECWCSRYICAHDVTVAATMLGLKGEYPFFNISSRLTLPDKTRLDNISQAFEHNYKNDWSKVYGRDEMAA